MTPPAQPMPAASPAATGDAPPAPLSLRRWRYAIGLLLVVYTLNFLDRQIINILAESIKTDLHLKDWQLGVLTGLSFALVYSLAALPVARFAERAHRPWIIGASLTIWSAFTALCGTAQGFAHLALARLGVGIGEAGASPAAHSLIVDYTPPEKRARALAIYQSGVSIGALLGLALGGIIADLYGWRTAFFLAGVPGVLVALLLVATLPEPRRRLTRVVGAPPRAKFLSDARRILSDRCFPLMTIGGGLMSLRSYGTQAFIASFFFRLHGDELAIAAKQLSRATGADLGPASVLGLSLGILGGVAGFIGTLTGGVLMDHFARKDVRHYGTVPALPQLVAAPFLIAGLFWPSLWGALVLMTLPSLFSTISSAPVFAGVQALATASTRATASALAILVITLVGLGLGPLFIGAASDLLAWQGLRTSESLRWALVIAELPALVGAAMLWRVRRYAVTEIGRR